MYLFIAAMGNSLSSDGASAGASAGAAGSGASSLIMLVLMIAVFYFLLIRPQKKRDKEAKEMLAAIKKGDKIVTIGGIRGTVAVVRENTVVVKVDDNTRIEFNKTAISSVIDKKVSPEDSKEAAQDSKDSKSETKDSVFPLKKSRKKAAVEVVEKPAEASAADYKAADSEAKDAEPAEETK